MKILGFVGKLIVSFLFFSAIYYCGSSIDLYVNPWIVKASEDWKWYNYFTSHHGLAVLYLKKRSWYFVAISIASLAGAYYWHSLGRKRN